MLGMAEMILKLIEVLPINTLATNTNYIFIHLKNLTKFSVKNMETAITISVRKYFQITNCHFP